MLICMQQEYIFNTNGHKNIMKKSKPKYVSMRIPKTEYDKLRKAREEMQHKPEYSWVGSLALGAFVGLVAGLAIKKLAESDEDSL